MQIVGIALIVLSLIVFVVGISWSMRRDYKLMVIAANELRKAHAEVDRREHAKSSNIISSINQNRTRLNNIIRHRYGIQRKVPAKIIPLRTPNIFTQFTPKGK